MRHFWLAVLLLACQPQTLPVEASLATDRGQNATYIVTLNSDANPRAVAAMTGVNPRYVYEHALRGFAATLDAAHLERLRRHPSVRAVEPNRAVTIAVVPSWGLDRIDQRSLPLDDAFTPPNSGAGVRVYILDTGVRYTHPELAGRVAQGMDVIGGDMNSDDCQGHGTHVAGTVAGATVGVARQATIVAVRMLGCDGSATDAQAIAAIDWVTANRVLPAAANASWGGPRSFALNQAIAGLVASGVTVAAAAGNSNADACGYSPAGEPSLLTVAASDQNDVRASFSNFGSCVDLFAPGVFINSSLISGGYGTKSGTSMASPHVAGLAALYLAANPGASPAQVVSAILNGASLDEISNPTGSPNRLVYSGIAGAGVLPPLPPPPLPEPIGKIWVGDLADVSAGTVKGQWFARVRVQLVSETGSPIDGHVEGMFYTQEKWGEREEETGLCATTPDGVCVMVATIPNKYISARFELKRVTGRDGAEYDPSRNVETSIAVRKP